MSIRCLAIGRLLIAGIGASASLAIAPGYGLARGVVGRPAVAAEALPPDAVILPEDKAAGLLKQCSRGAPAADGGTWRATAADVGALEARLPAAMKRAGATDGDLLHAPAGWRRQYVGIVVSGRRLVYGNFFPARLERAKDWRTKPFGVCDGGSSFFGVTYDVQARRILDVQFNGVA